MNSLSFLMLVKSFYSSDLPDLENIEKKGLLAVKIAQHYALRIDFLSEEMCYHLSKLYTHSFPTEKKLLSNLIEKDSAVLKSLKKFYENPFSSASVGQVHEGFLNNGAHVAIKVIRKNYEDEFLRDVYKIERLMRTLGYIWPKFNRIFNPVAVIENIKKYTLDELDLRNEVQGIEKLSFYREKYSKEFDLSNLKFPYVYSNLSDERILVTSFIEGTTFDDLLHERNLSYETLLELFRLHSFFIFKVGLFHGDIHPGNIILGSDGSIYMVDCASISQISSKLRHGLFWFFYYLSRYDYINAGKYLNEMSIDSITGSSYSNFQKEFLDLYGDFTMATVSEVSLTRKMMETIKLGINHGMNFGNHLFPVIKSLMYFDGMAMRCNPEAVLMEDVRNFTTVLEKYMG